MSEIISSNETSYKKRRIASSISELADSIPVIVVTGARQVGKSTMLRNEFADYDYITLDDYAVLEQAIIDPQSLWMGRDKVIIDEAQRLPQLFPAIKLAVDSSDRRRKFILSGSANLSLMERGEDAEGSPGGALCGRVKGWRECPRRGARGRSGHATRNAVFPPRGDG